MFSLGTIDRLFHCSLLVFIIGRSKSTIVDEQVDFARQTISHWFKLDNEDLFQFEHRSSTISSTQHHQITYLLSFISIFDTRQQSNSSFICPMIIYQHRHVDLRQLLNEIRCLKISKDRSLTNFDRNRTMNVDELEREMFDLFKFVNEKSYVDKREDQRRFEIFKANLLTIDELNGDDQGTARYGLTEHADLTNEQFRSLFLNNRMSKHRQDQVKHENPLNEPRSFPDEFDWRSLNAVTPVKNQGQCGSCWAFSVTGNIESLWKIRFNELFSLSEQELLDCDNIDQGCNGGLMTTAFEQIIAFKGLMTEEDYQYRAKSMDRCLLDKTKIRVSIKSYQNISQDEQEMAQWVAEKGPISIGLNANMMQFYFGGIAHPHRIFCNPDDLNHGVLIVGYGKQQKASKTIPFWIIKNSWGNHWGEQGYYRLYRGDGSCGVNKMCSSAIV